MDKQKYLAAVARYAEIEISASAAYAALRDINDTQREEAQALAALRQRIELVKASPLRRATLADRALERRQLAHLRLEEQELITRISAFEVLAEKHKTEAQRLGRLRDDSKPLLGRARAELTAIDFDGDEGE